jgi:predicted nucleic acid-binding protein
VIVLDTNVLSEPIRATPDPAVLDWLSGAPDDVAITAITVGEILLGVRLLPAGRRRDGLLVAVQRVLGSFSGRVLVYDDDSADIYAALQEQRRHAGHPLSVEDGMIAAICVQNGATLATRNVRDFEDLGLELVNPWTA